MATLYQHVLGSRFASLHPVLRQFHASVVGGKGKGRFAVTRAPGRVRAWLAWAVGLPPAAADVPVTLEVVPTEWGERWLRSFGGKALATSQWARGGLLLERAGPLCLGLDLDVVEQGMTFATRRVWLFGVPLPRRLAPSVSATAVPDEEGWTVTVSMTLPAIGNLMTYRGRIVPQWT